MFPLPRWWCSVFVVVLLCSGCRTEGDRLGEVGPREEKWPGYFVESQWVARNWDRLTIVDARDAESYASGHLRGAIHLPASATHFSGLGGRAKLLPLPQFEDLIASMGIGEKARVVVYSEAGGANAAELVLALDLYGHEKVALLVDGREGWEGAGFPVDRAPRTLPQQTYKAVLHTERIATRMSVMACVMQSNSGLLDLRAPTYVGFGERARIPSAVPLDFGDPVMKPKTMAAVQTLQEELSQVIDKTQQYVVYGDAGPRAVYSYLAMRSLGAKVSMYLGGWEEWAANPSLPVEYGDGQPVSKEPEPNRGPAESL